MSLPRFWSRVLPLLMVLAFLGACAPHVPTGVGSYAPPAKPVSKQPIDDLAVLPQDAKAYLDKNQADKPLVSQDVAKAMLDEYLARFYAPWREQAQGLTRKTAQRFFTAYAHNPGYDESGQPRTKPWADHLAWQANLNHFPNVNRPAITTADTSLRAMPTQEPRFGPPGKPGQGYPFDILQVSALWPGTPVYVDHVSRDGGWALVQTAIAPGWIRTADLAYVDEDFISQWTSRPMVGLVQDKVALLTGRGTGPTVGVGAVLPAVDTDGVGFTVLVPVAGAASKAQMEKTRLSGDQAVLLPMPITPANVAKVADQLMGQAYGWGGLDGKRDCSAATKDIFAPFGVWLPRNSASQAHLGQFMPLDGMTPEEKEQVILQQGIPYATLIWMPGHIMLYVGQYQGRPVVFQNLWGLRTLEKDGSTGRKVIGKAVISTLHLGEIYPEVGWEHIPLQRVQGLSVITTAPAPAKQPESEESGQQQEP